MPINLPDFNPASGQELGDALIGEVSTLGQDWWNQNSMVVGGHLKSLAEAAVQTGTALAAGLLTEAQADQILRMQEVALRSTLNFSAFMTFALAQQVVDTAFRLVGWSIFNRTGINLLPGLVEP